MVQNFNQTVISLKSLEALINISARREHSEFSALYVYIDEFKKNNYTHLHEFENLLTSLLEDLEKIKIYAMRLEHKEAISLSDFLRLAVQKSVLGQLSEKDSSDIKKKVLEIFRYVNRELKLQRKDEQRILHDKKPVEFSLKGINLQNRVYEEIKTAQLLSYLDSQEHDIAQKISSAIQYIKTHNGKISEEEFHRVALLFEQYLEIFEKKFKKEFIIEVDAKAQEAKVEQLLKSISKSPNNELREIISRFHKEYYSKIKKDLIQVKRQSSADTKLMHRRKFLKLSGAALATAAVPQSVFASDNTKDGDRKLKRIIDDYISQKWANMIKQDLPKIKFIAKQSGVPAEVILGGVLVEDIRFYTPDLKSVFSYSYLKGVIRRMTPNKALERAGHNPNPVSGKSAKGMVHDTTQDGAIRYLESLNSSDPQIKFLIANSKYNKKLNLKVMSTDTHSFLPLAVTFKAHIEYWKRSGKDILSHGFSTVSTFGGRMGILETLNCISSYIINPVGCITGVQHDSGFYTGSAQTLGQAKRWLHIHKSLKDADDSIIVIHDDIQRKIIPHNSPKCGGTQLWGWASYGDIVRVFVDAGYAKSLIEEK